MCGIEHSSASAKEKIEIYLDTVFEGVNMHLYSKFEENPPRNKVIGAEKHFCVHFKSPLYAKDTFLKISIG